MIKQYKSSDVDIGRRKENVGGGDPFILWNFQALESRFMYAA